MSLQRLVLVNLVLAPFASSLPAQVDWTRSGGRSGHAIASLGNGIVLAGGLSASQVTLSDTWEMSTTSWTPRSGSGTQLPAMYGHAMASASGGRVVAFGGAGSPNATPIRAETWVWNGNNWSLETPLGPSPRIFHAMAYDSVRNKIVLFGGSDGTGVLGDTWELDLGVQPALWRRMTTPVAPPARYGHAMAYDVGRGRVILTAGANAFSGGGSMIQDHWEWDGVVWAALGGGGSALRAWRPAMAYDAVRAVTVLVGGFDRPHLHPTESPLATTGEFNGASWSTRQSFPDPRGGHAISFHTGRGTIVLQGGSPRRDGANARSDTWEWAGTQWTQVVANLSPLERSEHAMCFDAARQRTTLFGGAGPVGQLQDTWVWDGQQWGERSVSPMPSARARMAMVYDAARQMCVLFGGLQGSSLYLNDTWEWDGVAWLQRTPATRPSARTGHALSFDGIRNRVVLFGGNATVDFNDTWEWDGTNWVRRSASGPMVARHDHAMAFDGAQTVMFGGRDSTNMSLNDTWKWDGTTWTKALPTLPPTIRNRHAMAFDEQRRRVVMFGGAGGSGDTWEWDGQRWSDRLPVNRPASRYGHGMAFDSVRNRTVMFGGVSSGNSDETWEMVASSVPASFDDTGTGCAGTSGVPAIDARKLPFLGTMITVELTGVARNAALVLGLGASNPGLHLDWFGMPTCYLRTTADVFLSMTWQGGFQTPISVPTDSGLNGGMVFLQCFVLDPAANSRGLVVSNGRRAVFEVR